MMRTLAFFCGQKNTDKRKMEAEDKKMKKLANLSRARRVIVKLTNR